MRVRVMRHFVPATNNLTDQVRPACHSLTYHKKRGPRTVFVEQIKNSWGILGVGSVVDRQPDFLSLRLKLSDRRTQPLARRHEQVIKNKKIGPKKQHEP